MNVENNARPEFTSSHTGGFIGKPGVWPDAWLLLLLLTYGRMYRVRDLALMSGQDRDRRMKNDDYDLCGHWYPYHAYA
jgi:hypothetical protein